MTGYHVEKLSGEPIVISILHDNWDTATELTPFLAELTAVLDAAGEPVHYITDVVRLSPGLQDLMQVTNQSTRVQGAVLHHPNIKSVLVVTESKLIDLAAKGLNSEIFGFVETTVFTSREDALAHARLRG